MQLTINEIFQTRNGVYKTYVKPLKSAVLSRNTKIRIEKTIYRNVIINDD